MALALGCGGRATTREVGDERARRPNPGGAAEWRAPDPVETPRPARVVLVAIDTLRSDHLSGYGYGRETTPRLDAMAAADGVRFEAAYASSSWTLPSMTSVLTSLHPHQHGVENRGLRLKDDVPTLAGAFAAQGWRTAAFVTHVYVTSLFGLQSGFAEFHELSIDLEFKEGRQLRAADAARHARAWLDANGDAQAFLYLHLFDPHWDYDPPASHRGRFSDPDYRGEATGRWEHLKGFLGPRRMPDGDLAQTIGLYDDEIAYTDAVLGDLFDELRAAGRWDDTLVVVLSDHGEEFQDHGSFHHIRTLYEEVLRVPLLLKLPGGRPAGWRAAVPERVRTLDVAPTILELAGLRVPPSFRGRSLLPLMRAPGDDRPVFARTRRHNRDKIAFVAGSRKLITHFGGKARPDELYDLGADPEERRSLAAADPAQVAEMRAALDAYLDAESVAEGGAVADVDLSPKVVEHLRRLGYVE